MRLPSYLWYDSERLPQRLQPQVGDIGAVDDDLAPGRLDHAKERERERGLAGASATHDPNLLSRSIYIRSVWRSLCDHFGTYSKWSKIFFFQLSNFDTQTFSPGPIENETPLSTRSSPSRYLVWLGAIWSLLNLPECDKIHFESS